MTTTNDLAQALLNAALALRVIHKRLTSSGDALVRTQAAAYASNNALDAFRALAAHESRAQPASVAGWVLVPREPNWDMRNEGREIVIEGTYQEPERLAWAIYKAMIGAAPQPAKENEDATK